MNGIMSKIHLEILDKKRQVTFTTLSNFKRYGYLAGGTALALQLKHRKSVDFDVFIKNPVNNYLRLKVTKIYGKPDFYVNTSDQISFETKDNINITFVWYFYKILFPLVKTDSLSLASVYDIAADKAHTIGRRAMWRDYVDFFFLLKERVLTIRKIVELAKRKFGGEFNEALFLQQLSYFGDLRETKIDFIKKTNSSSEIKFFLEKEVEKYLQTLKIG